MSASPNDAPSEIAQVFSALLQNNLIEIAPAAMVAYEYLITFDQEVTFFWRRKMTGATTLFLATRYLALLIYPILGMATYTRTSDESCTVLVKAQYVVSIIQYVPWAAFSALRALALSEARWGWASIVFILALSPFAVNSWGISLGLTGSEVLPFGCTGSLNLTPHLALLGVAVSRSGTIVADTLVIILTWCSRLTGRGIPGSHASSLGSILLVNGTIYFLVFIVLNALDLTLTALSIFDPFGDSTITVFTDPLTAILVCRFLLALQRANRDSLDGRGSIGASTTSGDSPGDLRGTLRFAIRSRAIGSLGGSILERPDEALLGDAEIRGEQGEEQEALGDQEVRGVQEVTASP